MYWFFSILTAAFAYGIGSLSSLIISSNFVFHRDLRRFGRGGAFVSNFRRVFGWKGAVKLLIVELILDILPILLGGILFGLTKHAVVGRALAGFCLVMGRMWPAIYELRGGPGLVAMTVAAIAVSPPVGIAVLLVSGVVIAVSRYLSLGTLAGAAALFATALLSLDDGLAIRLCVFISLAVIVRHIPAIIRLVNKKEQKISLEEDISYKFDEKF